MFFVLSWAWDKEKLWSPHEGLRFKSYHLSYSIYKHNAKDIADPSSLQNMCHIWTSCWALLTIESLWLSGRALEHRITESQKVWGSIPYGDLEFFLCLILMTRPRIYFSFSLPSSKLTLFLIRFVILLIPIFEKYLIFLLRLFIICYDQIIYWMSCIERAKTRGELMLQTHKIEFLEVWTQLILYGAQD